MYTVQLQLPTGQNETVVPKILAVTGCVYLKQSADLVLMLAMISIGEGGSTRSH